MSSEEHSEDDIALAGEYALHLLDAEERSAFDARLFDEAPLRRLVAEWEIAFARMADDIPAVTPPAEIKARVEAELFPTKKSGWLTRGRQLWAGLGGALAVLLLVVLLPIFQSDVVISHTGELASEDRTYVIAANYVEDRGVLHIERLAGEARPGRVIEMWFLPDGDTSPISLGVLPADQAKVDIPIPANYQGRFDNGLLEISDEPPGGSPIGRPTGDVLALGRMNAPQ